MHLLIDRQPPPIEEVVQRMKARIDRDGISIENIPFSASLPPTTRNDSRRQRSRLIRTADGRCVIYGASSFTCCVAILHRHFSNGQSRFRVRPLCVHQCSKEIL